MRIAKCGMGTAEVGRGGRARFAEMHGRVSGCEVEAIQRESTA